MWHAARRNERKIRGMMVDHKKRAERRREFYNRIQESDPAQFLRVYGRAMKIHVDPAVALAATSQQSMMPWNGDTTNMIDRFDVRGNLDMLPEDKAPQTELTSEEIADNRRSNYERYRSIVENDCAGVGEEQCLQQIFVDEQFGDIPLAPATTEEDKKKLAKKKAAIGFTYDPKPYSDTSKDEEKDDEDKDEDDEEEESDGTDVEDADLDISIDVSKITKDQAKLLNECGHQYGMMEQDFIMMLLHDREELEELREARALEEQRAQYSGRKSRRERRAYKDKRLAGRTLSPPSYAAKDHSKPSVRRESSSSSSPDLEKKKRSSSSSSRSRSREKEKVKFITSFGVCSDGEEEGVVHGPSLPQTGSPQTCDVPEEPPPLNLAPIEPPPLKLITPTLATPLTSTRKSPPCRSRSRSRRSRSGSRRSRSPRRSRSRSRRSRSRSRSRRRSRSRSRSPYRRRSSPEKPSVKRYRRPSLDSSNESDDSDTETRKRPLSKPTTGKVAAPRRDEWRAKEVAATAKEKLKRKMQLQIKSTYQAEQKAEMIKLHQREEERQKAEMIKLHQREEERQNREEELHARALEMRKRERERRRNEEGYDSDDSDSERRRRRRSRSRSRDRGRDRDGESPSRRGSPSRRARFTEERRPSTERRNSRFSDASTRRPGSNERRKHREREANRQLGPHGDQELNPGPHDGRPLRDSSSERHHEPKLEIYESDGTKIDADATLDRYCDLTVRSKNKSNGKTADSDKNADKLGKNSDIVGKNSDLDKSADIYSLTYGKASKTAGNLVKKSGKLSKFSDNLNTTNSGIPKLMSVNIDKHWDSNVGPQQDKTRTESNLSSHRSESRPGTEVIDYSHDVRALGPTRTKPFL